MDKMKRISLILATCVIVLGMLCTSCSKEQKFEFYYELEEMEWSKGTSNEIRVTIINASEKEYKYEGAYSTFCADAKLYCKKDDTEYQISREENSITTDVGIHTVKNGEERSTIYRFNIPTDAPLGEYHLELSYDGYKEVFHNVLIITE